MNRRAVLFLSILALLAAAFATLPAVADGSDGANGVVGNFEIEGDLDDDGPPADTPPEAVDWDSAAAAGLPVISFTDDNKDAGTAQTDDAFDGGSDQLAPGDWDCGTGGVPAKSDIVNGAIAFRFVETAPGVFDQFVFARWLRAFTGGDASLDYEFNQSSEPVNADCPDVPERTNGDVLITFDTEVVQGTRIITVDALQWQFNAGSTTEGTFTSLGVGAKHVDWDGAVSSDISFGELALNLSDTIGTIECGEFAGAYMKSRSSTSISSSLKDRTQQQNVDVGICAVFGVTKTASQSTANVGDEITYTITVTNTGNIPGTSPDIVDNYDEAHVTVSNINPSPASHDTTNGIITWDGVQLNPNQSANFTYTATFHGPFTSGEGTGDPPCGDGEFPVINTVTVGDESDTEQVCVAAAPDFDIDKSVSSNESGIGGNVSYKIRVTNNGDATGTSPDVKDDYDAAHVTVSNIDPTPASHDTTNGIIVWDGVELDPGEFQDFTYTGTFKGPFTGGEGTGDPPCGPGKFPVVNDAILVGTTEGDSEQVCVAANPAFSVTKTASDTSVSVGDEVTYTITVTNIGDAPGSTPVEDNYEEEHVDVVPGSINPNTGVDDGSMITWQSGVLLPTQQAVFSYAVTFHGPFLGNSGGGTCQTGEYPVTNTVTVTGNSDTEEVCVAAAPLFVVEKIADKTTAVVGDTVTYTITVTNDGDATGTSDPVVDNYEEDFVDVIAASINPNTGVDDGSKITWPGATLDPVAPDNTATFSYQVTITGPFPGPSGGGDCANGQFPVMNTVTVGGASDSFTVCVTATPDMSISKSAQIGGVAPGSTVVYTISFSNGGDADAANVVITEPIPDGTEFSECTGPTGTAGDCDTNGPPVTEVTWNLGTVSAGESGTVTLTVTLAQDVGCEVCNTATLTGTSSDGSAISVNTNVNGEPLCFLTTPGPNPDDANASGSAFAMHLDESLTGIDLTLPEDADADLGTDVVDSSQSGVGSNADDDELIPGGVLVPGVVEAHALTALTTSTVTGSPAEASQTSISEVANVDLLGGAVTANLVRAVAQANADGDSSSFNAAGSTIKNLKVSGVAVNDVTPGKRVDLPALVFGVGSYVAVFEQEGETSRPAAGQLAGGEYAADLTVNMIRVHVTNYLGSGNALEVVVANAVAHADFPQTEICAAAAAQSVSGHAFIARESTDPTILPVVVGFVSIPPTGGHSHEDVDQAELAEITPTLMVGVTDSSGTLGPDSSDASSFAEAGQVCLLPGPTGCAISATAVMSQSNSHADATGASDDTGTVFIDLNVLGMPITPDPNTVIEIPGIGFVVLNEQFCDGTPSPVTPPLPGAVTCGGLGETSSGLTVRAIHVFLLDPPAEGDPGAEIIVAEAHSDATYDV